MLRIPAVFVYVYIVLYVCVVSTGLTCIPIISYIVYHVFVPFSSVKKNAMFNLHMY